MNLFELPQCLALTGLILAGDGDVPVPKAAPIDGAPLVSIEFADADIRQALHLVAKQGGVNMIVSNDVQGTISMDLENATLEETLDAIMAVGGYRYERDGNIVTVQSLEGLLEQRDQVAKLAPPPLPPPALPEREPLVLRLRYVDAERVIPIVQGLLGEGGTVSMLETADHLMMRHNGGGNFNSGGVAGAPAATFGGGAQGLGGAGAGLAGAGANGGAGGVGEGGLQIGSRLDSTTVGEPAKSHTLVVVDRPEQLARIERVVRKLDEKPPQVVIEARFVEISLDKNQRVGIDWNAVARLSGAAVPTTAPFGSSSLGGFGPVLDGTAGSGIFPPAPATVSVPGQPGLFTFGTLDFSAFTAVLEMIQRDTDVELVSNPRVVVGDRHTATILVGERYPILSANVSEFGTVTEQLDRYEPIGVQLSVTPSVVGDEVDLLVRPSTSTLGADVSGSTGLSVARINSRQIDTQVRVRDGQTVVIGGLITSREAEIVSQVPLLGRVPLLGGLFRSTEQSTERVDLTVFLTVNVLGQHGLSDRQQRLFEDTDPLRQVPIQEASASPGAPNRGFRMGGPLR